MIALVAHIRDDTRRAYETARLEWAILAPHCEEPGDAPDRPAILLRDP